MEGASDWAIPGLIDAFPQVRAPGESPGKPTPRGGTPHGEPPYLCALISGALFVECEELAEVPVQFCGVIDKPVHNKDLYLE